MRVQRRERILHQVFRLPTIADKADGQPQQVCVLVSEQPDHGLIPCDRLWQRRRSTPQQAVFTAHILIVATATKRLTPQPKKSPDPPETREEIRLAGALIAD